MKKFFLIPIGILFSTSVLLAVPEKSITEAEITNIVMTINTGEISLAKMAQQKTTNLEVKKFATDMIDEHSKNNVKLQSLAGKEGVSPAETKESKMLKTNSEKKADELKKLNGKEFDKAYMISQIEMHKKALGKIDNELIPNTKDKDLRAMLDSTKVKVQEHLKHAEEINKNL